MIKEIVVVGIPNVNTIVIIWNSIAGYIVTRSFFIQIYTTLIVGDNITLNIMASGHFKENTIIKVVNNNVIANVFTKTLA